MVRAAPNGIISNSTDYHLAQERMALIPRYYGWIAQRIRPWISGRVLDLGSGVGLIYDHFVDQTDEILAVDFNAEVLQRLTERFPGSRVRTLELDLHDPWPQLSDRSWDTVLALDVLEHFLDDHALVAKISSALAPRGHVIFKVPAHPSLYGPVDQASGHYRRYDRRQLVLLMEAHGLREVRLRSMNPVGALAYALRRNRQSNFSRTLSPSILKMANFVMPILAACDHFQLPGLSLIGIFQAAGDPESARRS